MSYEQFENSYQHARRSPNCRSSEMSRFGREHVIRSILLHIFRARTVELGSPNEAVGLAAPSLACLARRGRRPRQRRMLIAQTLSASALCGRQWDGLKEGREERREARRRLACFPLSLPLSFHLPSRRRASLAPRSPPPYGAQRRETPFGRGNNGNGGGFESGGVRGP